MSTGDQKNLPVSELGTFLLSEVSR
jgi:hypothetical protein